MNRKLLVLLLLASCLTACASIVSAPDPDKRLAAAYLTTLAQIENALSSHPDIKLTRNDGGLVIRLPAADGFATGSAEPTAALLAMLAELTPVLNHDNNTELLVLGHTDSIGSESYNLRLSIARAEAVMDVLRGLGVSLTRLAADGRGEAEPIADNASEEGRALNRRVEIVLRPRV